jgi:two-component system nitrate/nitrite response regulator NarL
VVTAREARQPVVGVVIVGGARVYRDSLTRALESRERVRVLASAGDWSEAFGHIRALRPSIVLVDAQLAVASRAVRLVTQAAPQARVVALAVDEDEDAVLSCLEGGVSAYVGSDAPLDELVETIEHAATGELLCSPRIAAALGRRLSDLAAEREPSLDSARLTARELEVLHLIGQNLSNRQIAARLCIEVATVKNHVHNILGKLQISGRGQAAAWIRRAGATTGQAAAARR